MGPECVRHAIWWQVYPLGAVGAERAALSGAEVVAGWAIVHPRGSSTAVGVPPHDFAEVGSG